MEKRMGTNLVDLFTELSKETVKQAFRSKNDELDNKTKVRLIDLYTAKLRRKAFDILLQNYHLLDSKDPCETTYGANWNPALIILDYGAAFAKFGHEKKCQNLTANMRVLENNDFICLKEIYKLILSLQNCPLAINDFHENKLTYINLLHKSGLNFTVPLSSFFEEIHETQNEIHQSNRRNTMSSRNLYDSSDNQVLNSIFNRSSMFKQRSEKDFSTLNTSKLLFQSHLTSIDSLDVTNSYSNNSFLQAASVIFSRKHSLWDNFAEKSSSDEFKCKTSLGYKCDENDSEKEIKINYVADAVNDKKETKIEENIFIKLSDENVVKSEDKTKLNKRRHTNDASIVLYPIVQENCLKVVDYNSCFSRKYKYEKKDHMHIKNSFFQSPVALILALWEQEYRLLHCCDSDLYAFKDINVIALDEFLKDVKFLLIGIWTDTFKINKEQLTFKMENDIFLEGVTSETLQSFSKEFLDIGSCYLKLRHQVCFNLIKPTDFYAKERIILKVYWMSIFDYLCRHAAYVLKIPTNLGLLEFKSHVRNIYPIITTIAEVCEVFNSYDTSPYGGRFLTYLVDVIRKVTNRHVLKVLIGILKSCCEAYVLRLLQNWIFQGALDGHHLDFFVEHRSKNHKCKDRSYYVSFHMSADRVPSVLKGMEEKIFSCGKTIHMLNLIQPESKLCRLLQRKAYPKIKICMSDAEIEEEYRRFSAYAKHVKETCGQFMSISSLREEEKNQENLFKNYIVDVKKEQNIQRELLKKKKIEEIRLKREVQNQWLKEQMEFTAEEKKKKQLEEEIQNKLFLEKVQEISENERKILEEEKQNLKLFYEELMENMEKRTHNLSFKHRSKKLSNRNNLLRAYGSNEDIFELNHRMSQSNFVNNNAYGDILMSATERIINTDTSSPNSDVINANIANLTLESKLEDIKNDNISDKELLDFKNLSLSAKLENIKNENTAELSKIQLQNLILSREKYQDQLQFISHSESFARQEDNTIYGSCPVDNLKSNKDLDESQFINEAISSQISKSDAAKNKNKIMKSQILLGSENDVKSHNIKIHANKMQKKGKHITSATNIKSPKRNLSPKSEAKINKSKMLLNEYDIKCVTKTPIKNEISENEEERSSEVLEDIKKSQYGNKEKYLEKEINKTNAQKNKEKILEIEFGYSKESSKIVRKKEIKKSENEKLKALKNNSENTLKYDNEPDNVVSNECSVKREKSGDTKNEIKTETNYMNNEKLVTENKIENDVEEDDMKIKEFEASEKQNLSSVPNATEQEKKLNSELNDLEFFAPSSFSEKCIDIFCKHKSKSGDIKFFNLKLNQNVLHESSLKNSTSEVSKNEIQVLFRKYLEETSADGNSLAEVDINLFVNYLRKSVLIPLKVQEELANEAMLNYLLKEENMLSHFNSLRNYFLFNNGEFSRRFTHNIFATLTRCVEPQEFFSRDTLNEIVNGALNYTIHSSDPNIQNVSFEIADIPKFLNHSSHNILSSFELSYTVKWPLNIILTDKVLNKYRRIFHFLLQLKRINWTLNENFSHLIYSYKSRRIDANLLLNSPQYRKIQLYRHAMSQLMRTLENYISSCSLQFAWLNFQKNLEEVQNLDHLYEKHIMYIKDVLQRCFLTKKCQELLNSIHIFIELSLKFHYVTKTGRWLLVNNKYEHSKYEILKNIFIDFSHLIKMFLKLLNEKINSSQDLKFHETLLQKFDIILQ